MQTWHGGGQPWDSHGNIAGAHRTVANQCDQGLAALITDLKQRGLFEETLILCTGEFGRTPSVELGQNGGGASQGRDHNHWGFSLWLAGGGHQRWGPFTVRLMNSDSKRSKTRLRFMTCMQQCYISLGMITNN